MPHLKAFSLRANHAWVCTEILANRLFVPGDV